MNMNNQQQKKSPKSCLVFSNSKVHHTEALSEVETIDKVWENSNPMSTITNPIIGKKISNNLEEEGEDMIRTKRLMLAVNIFAILVCTGLLFNRASLCIERYIF